MSDKIDKDMIKINNLTTEKIEELMEAAKEDNVPDSEKDKFKNIISFFESNACNEYYSYKEYINGKESDQQKGRIWENASDNNIKIFENKNQKSRYQKSEISGGKSENITKAKSLVSNKKIVYKGQDRRNNVIIKVVNFFTCGLFRHSLTRRNKNE